MQIHGIYNYNAFQANSVDRSSSAGNNNSAIGEISEATSVTQGLTDSLQDRATNIAVTAVPDADYLQTLYEDLTRQDAAADTRYELTAMNYEPGMFLNMRV